MVVLFVVLRNFLIDHSGWTGLHFYLQRVRISSPSLPITSVRAFVVFGFHDDSPSVWGEMELRVVWAYISLMLKTV